MKPVRALFAPALIAGAVLILATSGPAFATPCTDAWAWTQKTSLAAGQRWDHCAIWDPNGQRMIIFGGRNASGTLGDTWSWSPATNTWTQLTPGSGPGARWGATAIYDAARQRMVVFGGASAGGGFSSTWALSLTGTATWTLLTTYNDPTPRAKHVAVYDPVNDRMVVFGGSGRINETWALPFATNTWSLINDQSYQVATDGCGAVYDPVNQRLVVIGGTYYCPCICPQPSVGASGEVSVLPLNTPSPTWTSLGYLGFGISQPVVAYDGTCQRILMYGGITPSDCVDSCNASNDYPNGMFSAISLSGAFAWTQVSTTGGPPVARGHHVGVLDPGDRRLFVFGGGHHASTPGPPCGVFSETYTYRNDTWQLQIPDVTPPGAVTNLVATPTCAGVQLTWTDTGDDGNTGTAAMVDIRRSTSPINAGNYNNTPQLTQFPPAGPAGTPEVYVDPVGACSPYYYYAMKLRDEAFNYSNISNVVLQQSTCTGCGGGGGCPFAHVLTADGWTEENSILGRSLDGGFVRDAYRVKAAPLVEGGVYRLKIREEEQETTTLDRVRLVAMDHDPGLVAFALEGRPALGRVVAARQVVTGAGEQVARTTAGSLASRFLGRPGDELVFDFAGSEPGGLLGMKNQLMVIRTYKKQPTGPPPITRNGPQNDAFVLGNTGIRLEAQDGSGRWSSVATRYPREHEDDIVMEAPAAQRYRLVFVGEHGITFVGRLEPVAGEGTEASLITAAHSRDADVRAAVRDDDGATLTLGHGEQLELSFRLPEPAAGKVRDVFLLSTGVYTTGTPGAEAARAELRLAQNQPNPFRIATEIGFTLPRAADVRLEVFDPLGRRIAMLAEGRMTSGPHSMAWNRLDPGGSPVKPGVYLYRLTAGREVAQKRMIVLP